MYEFLTVTNLALAISINHSVLTVPGHSAQCLIKTLAGIA